MQQVGGSSDQQQGHHRVGERAQSVFESATSRRGDELVWSVTFQTGPCLGFGEARELSDDPSRRSRVSVIRVHRVLTRPDRDPNGSKVPTADSVIIIILVVVLVAFVAVVVCKSWRLTEPCHERVDLGR